MEFKDRTEPLLIEILFTILLNLAATGMDYCDAIFQQPGLLQSIKALRPLPKVVWLLAKQALINLKESEEIHYFFAELATEQKQSSKELLKFLEQLNKQTKFIPMICKSDLADLLVEEMHCHKKSAIIVS